MPDPKITKVEQMILGLSDDDEHDKPYVALKYYSHGHQCFSEWDKDELKAFSNFVNKLRQVNWQIIQGSGGRAGHKTGFGFTLHKDKNKLPGKGQVLKNVSPDIPVFELRVTEKARVHGFRMKSVFFLVWLDRNHDIYPQ